LIIQYEGGNFSGTLYAFAVPSLIISGAVFELNKSYDQVFFVIGGVYVVDALVFGAAAVIQSIQQERQRRRYSAADGFTARGSARLQTSADVHLGGVATANASAVSDATLVSNYGAVTAFGRRSIGDGKEDNNCEPRNQTETTAAPSVE